MMSSDYPHGDPSADERFLSKLDINEDIPERLKEQLVGGNAARFYHI